MRRVLLLMFSVLLALPLLAAAASTVPATTLAVTFDQPGGAPMAGARVSVYYNEPSLTRHEQPLMASGTTSPAGRFTAALDTSVLPSRDTASVGGQQVFNAVVVASAPGQLAVRYLVLPLGRGYAAPLVTARAVPRAAALTPGVPLWVTTIKSTYRYFPVLAMNSADGVQTDLLYTLDSSTTRQTTVNVAYSPGAADGPWSVNGSQTEEASRGIAFPWREWNSYHQYVFANYTWIKQEWVEGVKTPPWYTWTAYQFATPVQGYDPNIWKDGREIGVIHYKLPPFPYSCRSCWWSMTPHNSGFTRDSGDRQTYGFDLATAGFLSMGDWATYGSITYQHWYYLKNGCGGAYARVMWADGVAPGIARIVDSDCMIPPS